MSIDSDILKRIRANDSSLPTTLDFHDQNLNATDIKKLVEALQNNDHVTGLDLNNNKIGNEGVIFLAQLNTLKSLSISGNHVGEAGVLAVANNKSITSLDLSYNEINGKEIAALTANLVLMHLNLAGNKITSRGVSTFADNITLTSLNLAENQIDDEGAITLGEKNKTLRSLILTRNQISNRGAIALAQHPKLTRLILAYNKVSSDGTEALAFNNTLMILDLSYNKLTAPGLKALSGVKAFIQNSTLKTLLVAGNQLDNWGLKALVQNKSITSLDVSYNQVGDGGIINLLDKQNLIELNVNYNLISLEGAKTLVLHPTLDKLHIRYNLLGDEGTAILAQSKNITWLDVTGNQAGLRAAENFAKNPHLKSLILSYNLLGDEGAIVIAQNRTLRELWISYNQIGDQGAIAFAQNPCLESLNVNYNYIGPVGRNALKQNKTLQFLRISDEQPPELTTENLSNTFLLSQDFLCIKNKEGIIQFFNPAFSRVLGYPDDELLGKSIYGLVHPEDRLAEIELSKSEQKFPIEYHENRYKCKDGCYRTICWSSQFKNNLIYTVGTDITEQKQIEKELIEKEKKIESDAITTRAAQAYTKEQTEFIAHLCHEIRNPLSGAYGNVEIARDQLNLLQTLNASQLNIIVSPVQQEMEKRITEIRHCLEAIVICIEYQKSILDDNLDVAKIAENKFVLENKLFDFKDAVQTIIKMFKASAEQKGILLKLELPLEEVLVKGDAPRIKKIIINLIGNAIKFTDTGQITVKVLLQAQTSDYTQIAIKIIDMGIGLDVKEIEGIFGRFTQASAIIGNQYGGSGLGLLIARSLAQLMGGDIAVESQKGKGSTFTCTIRCGNLTEAERKLMSKEEASEEKVLAPALMSKTSVPSLRKFTVLIVDDNNMNRRTLSYFIEKAGYNYLFAVNGQEAIEKYNYFPIDIILMDLLMPVMDGIEATRRIRQREIEESLPPVPIIAITGNAMESDQQKALVAGISDYITKPFSQKEVLQKVAAFLAVSQVNVLVPEAIYSIATQNPAFENPPEAVQEVPVLSLSYQQIFMQTVNVLLHEWKNKFTSDAREHQFISSLITKVLSFQEADAVFKKISAALKMPEYDKVKKELSPLRAELITHMKKYNKNKLEAMNASRAYKGAESLSEKFYAKLR